MSMLKKSLFINRRSTLSCEFRGHRAGSQLKIILLFSLINNMTFEHRHENKSCSECPEDQLNFETFKKVYKKCLNVRQKLGTRSHSLTLTVSHSLTLVILNNFCFHVYAQKSLSHSHTPSLSHSHTISLSQCLTLTLSLFHSLIHSLSTC